MANGLKLYFALCHHRSRQHKSMAEKDPQSRTDDHQERAPWEHKPTTPGLMFSGVVKVIT